MHLKKILGDEKMLGVMLLAQKVLFIHTIETFAVLRVKRNQVWFVGLIRAIEIQNSLLISIDIAESRFNCIGSLDHRCKKCGNLAI